MMNVLETTIEIRDLFSRYELCKVQESQVNKLVEKLQKKEVTIAVIGQFKRGKTTMINSILGNKLLPVGIVPITSAVTSIRYAEDARDTARVLFLNGLIAEVPAEELHSYISEQENSNNEKGVAEVELETPAEFLKDGLVLVDTPGVGSVHENNSKSAYDFARESDGVIFMLSVDSPINQIEVEYLKDVRKFAGKFYFAVNKIDTVDEDDLAQYIEYCSRLISDITGEADEAGKGPRIMPISAKKNIGIDKLTGTIREDLLTGSREIMERSVSLKLLEILEGTLKQIHSYREVLKMAPNIFERRFREMNDVLQGNKEAAFKLAEESDGKKFLRARLNEEKALMAGKVRELFGIEYYYEVNYNDAAEALTGEEYVRELVAAYDELAETLNAIFMYKEENVYTVARRIEDLNILMQQMRKHRRKLETVG